jgi:hypothetical protein
MSGTVPALVLAWNINGFRPASVSDPVLSTRIGKSARVP